VLFSARCVHNVTKRANAMNRRDAISISAALLLFPLVKLRAQPSVRDARVEDFIEKGRIRAAFAVAPILATRDPASGELRGVAVDLAHEVASRIGVQVQPVVYPRPGAVMGGLKSNEW